MAKTYLTYTLLDLVTAVTHALSGPPNANNPAAQIVNRAMNWLVSRHDWSWRRKIVALDFVANQNYITLPEDFATILSVKSAPSSFREVVPTSIDDLLERRQFAYGSSYELYYAIAAAEQTDSDELPATRLELFPTPGANLTGALALAYHRKLPLLVADDDVPDMPGVYHDLLLVLCRAMAVSTEEDQASGDWQLFNTMFADFTAEDGKAIGNSAGQMCSTLRRMRRVSRFFPNGRITA